MLEIDSIEKIPFSDVTLKLITEYNTDDVIVVRAHRAFLYAGCPLFRTMLESGMTNSDPKVITMYVQHAGITLILVQSFYRIINKNRYGLTEAAYQLILYLCREYLLLPNHLPELFSLTVPEADFELLAKVLGTRPQTRAGSQWLIKNIPAYYDLTTIPVDLQVGLDQLHNQQPGFLILTNRGITINQSDGTTIWEKSMSVYDMHYIPDSHEIVVAKSNSIEVLDSATLVTKKSFPHEYYNYGITFSPNNQLAVIKKGLARYTFELKVSECDSWTTLHKFTANWQFFHHRFSPDSTKIALLGSDTIYIYDMSSLQLLKQIQRADIGAIAFRSNSELFYTVTGRIFSWNIQTDTTSKLNRYLGLKINNLQVSSDLEWSACFGKMESSYYLAIMDNTDGSCIKNISIWSETGIAIAPDSRSFTIWNKNDRSGSIIIYDIRQKQKKSWLFGRFTCKKRTACTLATTICKCIYLSD